MVNPFFEQNRFLWERREGQALYEALSRLIPSVQSIDTLYRSCSGDLPALNLNQSPKYIWKDALTEVCSLGVLQELLEMARVNRPGVEAAVLLLERAEPARARRVLSEDVLMLDRTPLRDQLALLERDSHPKKVLLVRGDPGSGKSHARFLFEQSARERGSDIVYIKFGMIATVDELVDKLFAVLQATHKKPSRGDTTSDAWYRSVCTHLQEQASIRGRPLWIAVDDLGLGPDKVPLMDKEIRVFCEQLALNLMDPSVRQWFRMMLIHYPESKVPTRWDQSLWCQVRFAETDVAVEHVAELLRAWAEERQLGLDESELVDLAARVIADAEAPVATEPDEDSPPRLQRIHDALLGVLADLARRGAGP